MQSIVHIYYIRPKITMLTFINTQKRQIGWLIKYDKKKYDVNKEVQNTVHLFITSSYSMLNI